MNTNKTLLLIAFIFTTFASAQVGIGTQNPQGIFNIDGAKDNAATGIPTTTQQQNDFVVMPSGSVGIGTTSPVTSLHVIGGSSGVLNLTVDGQGGFAGNDAYFQGFGTSKGQSLIFLAANGTAASPTDLALDDDIGSINFGPRIAGGYGYSSSMILSKYKGNGTTNLSNLNFSTSNTQRMIIDENGNVGIGTRYPSVRFQVDGGADNATTITTAQEANDFVVTAAGNVGVGTVSPATKLSVKNSTSSSSALFDIGNNAGTYTYSVSNAFNNANFGSNAADYAGNGITNAQVINLSGQGMNIYGDNIGPWATNEYDLGTTFARWRNIYTTNALNVSSDARLKSNINPINNATAMIMKLSPKIYDKYSTFEKVGDSVNEYGFLAQELKKIVPQAVSGNDNDKNPMGVKYEMLIPILTKAIQEQQAEIEALKAALKRMEK